MAGSEPAVTQADVLQALAGVPVPERAGDLVSLGWARDVQICDRNVAFHLAFPFPPPAQKEELARAARAAVQAVPGVTNVNVRTGSGLAGRPIGAGDLLPEVKNIVAVASGKGGVGKSTVAANLAASLALEGAATGLLDADIYGPSIPTMMGVHRPPFVEDGKMLPLDQHGVKLMSLGFLMPDNAAPVIWRGPMVGGAVRQMLADVRWGPLDYLFVDLPPGTGDAQLTLAQIVPLTGAVIVMTSQDVAVNIASKALAMFQKLNVPVLGIVENMSTFVCPHCARETPIFTAGGGASAAERLGVPFLGAIPLDPAVVEHGDAGRPTVVAAPESAQAAAFRFVAASVAARLDELKDGGDDPLGGLGGQFGG